MGEKAEQGGASEQSLGGRSRKPMRGQRSVQDRKSGQPYQEGQAKESG